MAHGTALLAAAAALAALAAGTAPAQQGDVSRGRSLFAGSCASCHGPAAEGIPGKGPSLRGVGAAAADFYLRTGRMPLSSPDQQPRRAPSRFRADEIRALVAYVASFGGPPIPSADPRRGNLAEGMRLFSESCQGCHQTLAQGGIVPGAQVPSLHDSTARDVAEAVEVGPYVMPKFGGQFDQRQLDSLARYVQSTDRPRDVGGWGIGHIGPIPEGMVAWLLGALVLVLVARLLGKRIEQ